MSDTEHKSESELQKESELKNESELDSGSDPDSASERETNAESERERRSESDTGQDLRLLEALLFAAAEPLALEDIAARLPEGADVGGMLTELEAAYRNRGVNIVRVAGKWTLRTAPDLAPRLLLERTVSKKLSRAAIETLAIVAYHQPVTRGEIEEIRGVALSKGTLDTLMEAGWVKPRGRRQSPGRPATWVTTDQFLLQFGLDALSDLPGLEELKAAGLLDLGPGASLGELVDDEPGEAEEEAAAELAELPVSGEGETGAAEQPEAEAAEADASPAAEAERAEAKADPVQPDGRGDGA